MIIFHPISQQRCGLLGFLVAPFYIPLISPMCAIVFVLYCIPTIYLTLRLPYHTRKLHDHSAAMVEGEHKRKLLRMHKLSKKISRMDKQAHRGGPASQEESCFPDEWGWGGFATLKNWALQLFSSIFCLCILYSIALVFAESTGLFVEVRNEHAPFGMKSCEIVYEDLHFFLSHLRQHLGLIFSLHLCLSKASIC